MEPTIFEPRLKFFNFGLCRIIELLSIHSDSRAYIHTCNPEILLPLLIKDPSRDTSLHTLLRVNTIRPCIKLWNEGRKASHNNFSSEPPQNPRPFNIIYIEGRGFRGGSDEKMRRMWLGLEIVVAGLPPLAQLMRNLLYVLLPWICLKSVNNKT